MTDLENAILCIINEATCTQYCGKLKVLFEPNPPDCAYGCGEEPEPTKVGLYMLLLYLNQEQAPMVLSYQGDEEAFKEFVRKEMKTRKMHTVGRYRLLQLGPNPELLP